MKSYKTRSIVLRTRDLSEKDKIITFFSPTLGKFNAVVKGVKKLNSKSIGKMEPMNLVALESSKGRNLDVISQSEFICSFPVIRQDLQRTAAALYMLDMINRNTEEREENRNLFNLLKNCLYMLEREISPAVVSRVFDVKFISVMGYRPILDRCVVCEGPGPSDYLNLEQGGLICRKCRSRDRDGETAVGPELYISRAAIESVIFIQKADFGSLYRYTAPDSILREVQVLLNRYIDYVLPGGAVFLKNYEDIST